NGGGYTQVAFDLLGYFIGNEPATIVKDRSALALIYSATEQDYILDEPMVFITNQYTGSSSEIVTAAVKDYEKATIIGQTTYGSGRVKQLMPLSNGDYLKMTIKRFYSPKDNAIDEVGVKPHVELEGIDEATAAVLMLADYGKDSSDDKSGYVQFNAGPNDFAISLESMRKPEFWQAGNKLLDTVYMTTNMKLGGTNGWEAFPENLLKERQKLYYPGYVEAGSLSNIPLDKKFKIAFNQDINWSTVGLENIELINASTGERVKCNYTYDDKRVMWVNPNNNLELDTDYWLVIHPDIKDVNGNNISGGVAVAKTVSK
ncbi:MAG: S41 family peptidase, partial [Eubacteriales bacterium]